MSKCYPFITCECGKLVSTTSPQTEMITPPPETPVAEETLEEIAERVTNEWYLTKGATAVTLADMILSALRNERERICRLLCEWCGNDEYDLVWHHEEWRRYRKRDMYVEYCKAQILRGRPSGKESNSDAE